MMVEVLKQAGTWHDFSEELKMSVNTGDSCSAQCFRMDGETESGPVALRGFCLLKSLKTSLSIMDRVVTVVGEKGETLRWAAVERRRPLLWWGR